jgi:hypothetical protein
VLELISFVRKFMESHGTYLTSVFFLFSWQELSEKDTVFFFIKQDLTGIFRLNQSYRKAHTKNSCSDEQSIHVSAQHEPSNRVMNSTLRVGISSIPDYSLSALV